MGEWPSERTGSRIHIRNAIAAVHDSPNDLLTRNINITLRISGSYAMLCFAMLFRRKAFLPPIENSTERLSNSRTTHTRTQHDLQFNTTYTRICNLNLTLSLSSALTLTLFAHFIRPFKNFVFRFKQEEKKRKSNKLYRFWKKLRFKSFARGINWERLDRMPPPICKSLNVSSRITAKLLVRRKLHVSDLLIVSKVCSIRSYIDSTLSAAGEREREKIK